jgi:hypothetical protein
MAETPVFLQNTIFTKFLLPFLLVFFIIFAILEKTKLLGEGKTQINALISFVIGLIFIAAFNYSAVVNNIVLFAVIAIVVLFVGLLLWTFLSGEAGLSLGDNKGFRTVLLVALFIAVGIGVIWAFGIPLSTISNSLFNQVWSQPFWTNLIFIVLIGAAIAIAIGSAAKKG